MSDRVVSALRRGNRTIGLACGLVLLATGGLILVEILLRQTPFGALGGSDEYAGYAMAAIATWGFSYALVERAHIRIDLLQRRLLPAGRVVLDLLALLLLAGTTWVVTFHSWSVLAKTLERGSRANTPLETPLWIPQAIWFGGWVWFALTATLLLLVAAALVFRRRLAAVEALAGCGFEGGREP
ncbi:MAG: TRAP transporter small permease [Kiloniellales bacterium]|nr:TRAP transporter small permease [Kiloniellales bacterium]